jgi:hypothetical protein
MPILESIVSETNCYVPLMRYSKGPHKPGIFVCVEIESDNRVNCYYAADFVTV